MSFTLFTLPSVSLRTFSVSETGRLSLDCISTTTAEKSESAVILVIRINNHSFTLEPASSVSLAIAPDGSRTYSFVPGSSDGSSPEKSSVVQITVPPTSTEASHVAEDVETFDSLLAQYSDLSWSYDTPSPIPPPLPARKVASPSPSTRHVNIGDNVGEEKPVSDTSLRGKLVLMDDSNGEVVGELPQTMHLHEDSTVAGQHTTPVVLELQEDMYDACTGAKPYGAIGDDLIEAREVIVRAVPPEEQDWMLKGATLVSQAISGSTSVLVKGITSASNYYIAHSKPGTPSPSPKPQPSPTPSSTALARAHTLSGQAAKASARTADYIEGVIRRAVGGKPKVSSPRTFNPGPPTPVTHGMPPSYSVYTPKPRAPPPPPPSGKSEKVEDIEEEPQERKPLRMRDKLILSANLVLTTVDDSARRVFEVGSGQLGAVVGHKYGPDAKHSTQLATHTARNIVLVYVDVRGFARRALLKKAGTEFVKARFSGKDKPKASST